MALSNVGYASAATTSATLPAFNVGDLAVVFAFRDGNNTPPTLPSGWTDKASSGAFSCSSRVGYRVLQSGDTTTGVWTNATEVQVVVVRGQHATTPLGTNLIANGTNSSSTIGIDGPLTLNVTDGTSWILGVAGHRTATDVLSRTISGMTTRSSGGAATALGAWTEQVASWPAEKTATVNASSGWRSYTLEILAAAATKQTATAEVSLAGADVPTTRTSHEIVVRVRKVSGAHSATLRAQLYEGATARSAVLETSALTTSLADYTLPVADADAAAIGSYANLSVRFTGYSAAGDAAVLEVAAVDLRLPSGSATTKYGAVDSPFTFGSSVDGVVTSAGDKTTGTFELSLGSGNTPATRTSHAVVVRARKTNGAHTATIRVQLYEGSTARSAVLETSNLTTSLADYTLAVADVDAATIGSYANLSVRVRGYASTGDAAVFEVAAVSLTLPAGTSADGAATLSSFATITVGGATGTPIYPGAAVYPRNLATVSATATITAAATGVTVFGAAVLPTTVSVIAGGASPPTSKTGLVVLASTATVTAVAASAGAAIGQVVLASTATIAVGSFQTSTGAAALASTATITVGGDVPVAPPPPGFTDGLPHMPDMLVAVAFDSQPLDTVQLYEGITRYVRAADTKRGRQFELDRTEAGTSHLVLSNLDGRFNPENPASPYYPGLKPTRRMKIQAAWASVTYTLFVGYLEGYPQQFPGVGFDRTVQQDAVDLYMALGLARFMPGSATLASEMVTPAHNQDSTEKVRELINVSSTALPMPQTVPFEIVIDKDRVYAEKVQVLEIRTGNTYLVERDPLAATGHTPGATVDTLIVSFGQEYTGQRIRNVLSMINLPVAVAIDDGVSLLAASSDVAGASPLEQLQEAASVEQGRLFVSASGVLTFHSRHHFFANEKTVRATFGDAGGSELTYRDATVTHDDSKLYNIVRVTPASGNTQEARDDASIADHFERPLEVSWPLADDNDALGAAQYMLDRFSRMRVRVPSLELNGSMEPAQLWPTILSLEIGQRYRFRMRPRDGTQMIDKQLVVEGIGRNFSPSALTTSVQLSLADTNVYWQLEVAGQSELDNTTRLAY